MKKDLADEGSYSNLSYFSRVTGASCILSLS